MISTTGEVTRRATDTRKFLTKIVGVAAVGSNQTWAQRRRKTVRGLRIALSLATAAAVCLLAYLAARWRGLPRAEVAAELLIAVLNDRVKLSTVAGTADSALVAFVEAPAFLLLFGLSFVTSYFLDVLDFLKLRALSGWIFDRFLAPFNGDILRRATQPQAFDPLKGDVENLDGLPNRHGLAWVSPSGRRAALWREALTFVRSRSPGLTGVTRTPVRRGDVGFTPFQWILFAGPAGTGKSRTALECGLSFAQEALFSETRRETRLARLGAYLRLHLSWLQPRPHDPWDVGEIREGHTARNVRELSSALAKWQPRRPTILILDDPTEEWAAAAVHELYVTSDSYRFPVRLIVVNQTIPTRLGLVECGGRWVESQDSEGGFCGKILTFSEATAFGPAEVAGIIKASGLEDGAATSKGLERILAETRGNPFLVELAVAWIGARGWEQPMTRASLLSERVQRVASALAKAGLRDDLQLRALACATLAGGAVGLGDDRPGARGARKDSLASAYKDLALGVEELSLAFPDDVEIILRNFVPPIRPDLVGDAFCKWVIASRRNDPRSQPQSRLEETVAHRLSEDAAVTMVAAAWRANPGGMVRSVSRFVRLYGGDREELFDAIADVDAMRNCGANPSELEFVAPLLLKALCRREAQIAEAPLSEAFLDFMSEAVAHVPHAAMDELWSLAASLADPPRGDDGDHPEGRKRRDRIVPITRILTALLHRSEDMSTDQRLMAHERAVEVVWRARHGPIPLEIAKLAAGWIDDTSAPQNQAVLMARGLELRARVQASIHHLDFDVIERDAMTLAQDAALLPTGPGTVIAAYALGSLVLASTTADGGLELTQRVADQLLQLDDGEPDSPLNADRADALACLAHAFARGSDPEGALSTTLRLEQLSNGAPSQRLFDLARARGQRALVKAMAEDDRYLDSEAGRRELDQAASRVDATCRPYQGDLEFELERIKAWRHALMGDVSGAIQASSARALEAAERVEALGEPFLWSKVVALEIARVLGGLAMHACSVQLDEADALELGNRLLSRVRSLAGRFPDDLCLQEALAEGHLKQGNIFRSLQDFRGRQGVRDCAEAIAAQIAAGYRSRRMTVWGIRGWSAVAQYAVTIPDGEAARDALLAAETAQKLFESDPVPLSVKDLAKAWACAAEAIAGSAIDNRAQTVEACLKRVKAFYKRTPTADVAAALSQTVSASVLTSQSLTVAQELALEALAIGQTFPASVGVGVGVCGAQANVSLLASRSPSPLNAEIAESCADVADDVSRSLHDAACRRNAAVALVNASHAFSNLPEGVGANRAHNLARRTQACSREFPNGEEFSRLAAIAWANASFAWANAGQSSGIAPSEEAGAAAWDIHRKWPNNPTIADLTAMALCNCANAYKAGDGGQGQPTQSLAEKTQAIAEAFPDVEMLAIRAASVWSVSASMWRRSGVAGVEASEQSAVRTLPHLKNFPNSALMVRHSVSAFEAAADAVANYAQRHVEQRAKTAAQHAEDGRSHFPDDQGLAELVGKTWRHAAFAAERVSGAEGPLAASLACEKIEALMLRFPKSDALAEELVSSISSLTYCCTNEGEGPEAAYMAQAGAERAMTVEVSRLDASARDNLSNAWVNTALAWAQYPSWDRAKRAEHAAVINETIVLDPDAAVERRSKAWSSATVAWAGCSESAAFDQALRTARKCAKLASGGPENEIVQRMCGTAWREIVTAPAAEERLVGKVRTEALDVCAQLLGRFPTVPEFRQLVEIANARLS